MGSLKRQRTAHYSFNSVAPRLNKYHLSPTVVLTNASFSDSSSNPPCGFLALSMIFMTHTVAKADATEQATMFLVDISLKNKKLQIASRVSSANHEIRGGGFFLQKKR